MKDGSLHWKNRNLTGQSFGMLTAIQPSHSDGKKMHWLFKCTCGNVLTKSGYAVTREVKRGGAPNCGCATRKLIGAKNTTHGMSRHPAYAVWRSMCDRCRLPTHQAWKNYGARGIVVCAEWEASFENFWRDMGATYRRGLTLDRLDNNGDYDMQNCAWRTHKQQAQNTRRYTGVDMFALSEQTGVPRSTLYYRWKRGLPLIKSTTL
jgi:hypothetical protein